MTLPGFESIPATNAGGTFNGSPWKIVLHTTEGATAAGAIGAYRSHGGWPHFTVDPSRDTRMQHYELNVSSRALAHPPSTPETNRAGAINIEIVGFATASPTWPLPWLQWLGTQVLSPIRAVCPFALAAPLFVRYPDSYGLGAAQRFTRSEWATYSGIVGHQHCPDNDHGDPGAIDVTAIISAIDGIPVPPSTPPRRLKVNAIVSDPISGETQIVELHDDGLIWLRNIKDGADFYNLPPLPDGKVVSLDAGYRKDGTLDVSVRNDKGQSWIIGAPPGQRFAGWYQPG